jgi:hypothetical protein
VWGADANGVGLGYFDYGHKEVGFNFRVVLNRSDFMAKGMGQ